MKAEMFGALWHDLQRREQRYKLGRMSVGISFYSVRPQPEALDRKCLIFWTDVWGRIPTLVLSSGDEK